MNINNDYLSIDPPPSLCEKVKQSAIIERTTAVALMVLSFSFGLMFYDHLARTGSADTDPFLIGGAVLFSAFTLMKAFNQRAFFQKNEEDSLVYTLFRTAINIPAFGILAPFLAGMTLQGITKGQLSYENPNAAGVADHVQNCIETLSGNWSEYFITSDACLKGPNMICNIVDYRSMTCTPYPNGFLSFSNQTINLTDIPTGTCAYQNLSYSNYETNLLTPLFIKFKKYDLGPMNCTTGIGKGAIGLSLEALCSQFESESTQAAFIALQSCLTTNALEFLEENFLAISELEIVKPFGNNLDFAASTAGTVLFWFIAKRFKKDKPLASCYNPLLLTANIL